MKNKDKVIIIRVTEEENKIVKELRQIHSVNISNLVRGFLRNYYETEKKQKNQT